MDGGDCDGVSNLEMCHQFCYQTHSDGKCDESCNVEVCDFDFGDCVFPNATECAEGCRNTMIGNKFCDPHCNVDACEFDGGDCEEELWCASGCAPAFLGDGVCDEGCANYACKYDCGDCDGYNACYTGSPYGYVSEESEEDEQEGSEGEQEGSEGHEHDGYNEGESEESGNDGECTPYCPPSWRGNGNCNHICNSPECNYDDGD